jgi:1-acyl-sn-glycerol-3-phosphate acyltransferase
MVIRFVIVALLGIFITDKTDQKRYAAMITSRYSRKLLSVLHIHVCKDNRRQFGIIPHACLIYANHLSYLDVLAMAAAIPCIFVTSSDVGAVGLIGGLTRLGGSIIIDRRNKQALRKELPLIEGLLRDGNRITLFPEGTSSNGSGVLPFKASFAQAALNAKVPLLPIRISYRKLNGEELKRDDADRMDTVRTDSVSDRKEITAAAYSSIASAYTPIKPIKSPEYALNYVQ